MPADFDLFVFASPPRTATVWIRQAAVQAGLRENRRTEVHKPHLPGPSGVVRLSCVRHPVEWLRSYFTAIYPGKIGVPEVDVFRFSGDMVSDFESFVRLYLEECESKQCGLIGNMFAAYGADVCLRVEDLPLAFTEFLETLGVPSKMVDRAGSLYKANASDIRKRPKLSKSLRDRILAVEAEFVDRYEY